MVRAGNDGGRAPEVFLVHGEASAQDAFATQLHDAGYDRVRIPERHARLVV